METQYSVSEAAQRVGLSTDTLRYYEKAGLMPAVQRSEGGHRFYSQADLQQLTFIKKMRHTGMGISALRAYFATEVASERRRLMQEHRTKVEAELKELHECLSVIDYKLDLYKENK